MSRRANDSAGSVLSFTFLDVLMCTMGSLLLLLVVFGVIANKVTREKRPGEQAKITLEALAAETPDRPKPASAPAAPEVDPAAADPAELAKQLEALRREQAQLEAKRVEVAKRRREQEQVIAHLEDHERRLEDDLGKLYVTLQALNAAEQKTTIDREQAAAEAERLAELIRDTEARLDDMRQNDDGKKSFAIVPYKGASGTFRRPIFVECTADAVTIQPEGIRLTVQDFDGPLRSGNPLAAAIRAAHEELNARAAAAGQAEMPDPYPLLIVRPDGAAAYAAAVDAIRSWDSDYGYEFVEADWKLTYPEPDPKLGQMMGRAVDQARERQALLARVAPTQYGARLSRTGVVGAAGGAAGQSGFDALVSGGDGRIGAHGGEGALDGAGGGGSAQSGSRHGSNAGNFSDEFGAGEGAVASASTSEVAGQGGNGTGGGGNEAGENSASAADGVVAAPSGAAAGTNVGPRYGAAPSGSSEAGQGADNQYAASPAGAGAAGGSATDSNSAPGASGAQGGTAGGNSANGAAASAGGAGASGASSMASAGGAPSQGAAGAAASSASAATSTNMGAGAPTINLNARRESAADKRGVNWADAEGARRASAIARPIRVQVSAEQIAVLDSDNGAASVAAAVVPFQQPVDQVLDQLAAAVAERKADWGIAGDGMYWRPTLVIYVTPGAERQAARLTELLDNSGIDVRLPQTAARPAAGGAVGAPR